MNFQEFKTKYQKVEPEEFFNTLNVNPLVNVCVQTYQHAGYIRKCLDGILMQNTDFSFHILLGEDESTDGTREICKAYAARYPDKIRLFLHNRLNNIEINDNPTGRFNFIYNLYQSTGEYIAFCDGDDYWTDPLKLQKQVDFLRNHATSKICFTSNEYLTRKDEIFQRNVEYVPKVSTFFDLIEKNYMVSSTVVFRNSIKEEGLPSFLTSTFVADWTLFLWLVKDNSNISFLNFISTVYRSNVGISAKFKFRTEYVLQNTLSVQSIFFKDKTLDFKKEKIRSIIRNTQIQLMAYQNKKRKYIKSIFWFIKAISFGEIFNTIKIFCYSFKLGVLKKY